MKKQIEVNKIFESVYNKEIELAFHYLNCQPLLKKEHYKKRTALPKNYEVRLKKIKESISSKKLHRNLL